MKRHLNTLYVTTEGAYLRLERETVVVRVEDETKLRMPLHLLRSIVGFGRVSASPQLMGHCAEVGVSISFLSRHGRFLARVQGPTSGNVRLRRAQHRASDSEEASGRFARSCVLAKVANCRALLQRRLRDHRQAPGSEELKKACHELAQKIDALDRSSSVDRVRGIEGDAARVYFQVFDHLIVQQKSSFRFERRSRRPPLDPVNALLSFGYTLLTHDVLAALEAVGLDPQVGFLHRDRPGRPGLALDLMEELRPYIVDRVVLSLINRRQVRASGFRTQEAGAVMMDDDTRRTFLTAYQAKKAELVRHPFLNEESTVGLIPHIQARLAARTLAGDLDIYPPFLTRG